MGNFILGLLLGAALGVFLKAFIDGEDSSYNDWDDDDWRHYYD